MIVEGLRHDRGRTQRDHLNGHGWPLREPAGSYPHWCAPHPISIRSRHCVSCQGPGPGVSKIPRSFIDEAIAWSGVGGVQRGLSGGCSVAAEGRGHGPDEPGVGGGRRPRDMSSSRSSASAAAMATALF